MRNLLTVTAFGILLLTGCGSETPPAATKEDGTVDAAAKGKADATGANSAAAVPDTGDGADEGTETGAKSHAAADATRHQRHKPNRLAKETSPYLLMHAHNPVDWFPWGDEAFEKAKQENKPIFLSIGYSSCYWCHVMERESFMDDEIAAFLNEHFVCIKVDREERPDVDDIYMTAVQIMTRRGGWPLSAFLTPAAKPFYGGTYFPARAGDRGSRGGFLELVQGIKNVWESDAKSVLAQGDQLADAVAEVLREQYSDDVTELDAALVDNVQSSMQDFFDEQYGGFGQPPFPAHNPKFPSPPDLLYLVDRVRRHDDEKARQMLLLTLDKMAEGGIRDHLGGGFHRYSVDRFWHVPHFEKMLYDNGQLASVYAEAFELTDRQDYRRVVVELLDFVLREMTDEAGAFYSAIDAETDAEEGKYYRWEAQELEAALDDKAREFLGPIYSFSGEPNFRHEGHEFYVLQLSAPLREVAEKRGTDEASLEQKLVPLRKKLLAARTERKRPITDTKILTSWNGLMIRGFADAGRILQEPRFTAAAIRAAEFVLDKLKTDDGRLLRTYREGTAKLNAYLEDYAFLVDGLIALHRATGDDRWLEAAGKLTDTQIALFWDEQSGGFFFTSGDHETLIARAKKRTDNVIPSGNGIAAQNLVYLASQLPEGHYRDHAEKTLGFLAEGLTSDSQARSMPATAVAIAAWLEAEK